MLPTFHSLSSNNPPHATPLVFHSTSSNTPIQWSSHPTSSNVPISSSSDLPIIPPLLTSPSYAHHRSNQCSSLTHLMHQILTSPTTNTPKVPHSHVSTASYISHCLIQCFSYLPLFFVQSFDAASSSPLSSYAHHISHTHHLIFFCKTSNTPHISLNHPSLSSHPTSLSLIHCSSFPSSNAPHPHPMLFTPPCPTFPTLSHMLITSNTPHLTFSKSSAPKST